MTSIEEPEANAPLNITVTSGAAEVLTWRTLARQAVPMLERPEQFHISQRSGLAQSICLLLDGDLELEDVFSESRHTKAEYEPGCWNEEEDGSGESGCADGKEAG